MHEHYKLQMDDGVKVHINMWKEEENDKGVILILHGMAEHSMRYEDFANYLTKNGYIVYACDHRGHGITGKEMNKLGFFADEKGWHRVVKDISTIIKWIKENNNDKKIYLFGHSMGSLLARTCIQSFGNQFSGVIISGTTLGGNKLKKIGGIIITNRFIKKHGLYKEASNLDKITFGSYNKKFKPNKTQSDWLSRDEKKVNEYVNDDLCGFICTAGMFRDLLDGVKITTSKKNINNIPKDLPILLFSGDKDPVSIQGKEVKKLYNTYKKVGIKDVSIKLYENGRHEMLNETNKEIVYNDILNWLKKHNK